MAHIKSCDNKIKTYEGLRQALDYITNPLKAEYITRVNCYGNTDNLMKQFSHLRLANNQDKGIIAQHFTLSFAPDDNITAEQVHQFGLELAKKCFPDYQVVVSTHVDKGHLHNHFILNSCSLTTGLKYHDNKASLTLMREESDRLCKKYGVSIIDPDKKSKSIDRATLQLAMKNKSWKIQLLSDLDNAVKCCKSQTEFIDFLTSKDYEVRYGKYITIKKIGEKKSIRTDTLARQFGEQYTRAELEKAMGYVTYYFEKPKDGRNKKRETVPIKSEWQKIQSWTFSQANPNSFEFQRTPRKFFTARLPRNPVVALLRIINCALLCRPCTRITNTSYRRKKLNRNFDINSRSKYRVGNINYNELTSAQGDNFLVKVPASDLGKLITYPIFYSANIDIRKQTAVITVKEYDKEKLSKILGYQIDKMSAQSDELTNILMYRSLKQLAAGQNTKLAYLVISDAELGVLKEQFSNFAVFPKDDKYNIAFLPSDKEKVLTAIGKTKKSETEYEKNCRINNEIKKQAALMSVKPKYKVVSKNELDAIRELEIKFAVFKIRGKDEYNIVYLPESDEKISQKLHHRK